MFSSAYTNDEKYMYRGKAWMQRAIIIQVLGHWAWVMCSTVLKTECQSKNN